MSNDGHEEEEMIKGSLERYGDLEKPEIQKT